MKRFLSYAFFVLILLAPGSCRTAAQTPVKDDFSENEILSIEDLLKITKMKNMQEAAELLAANGYVEAKDDDAFYSSEVATFWTKDCEVEQGINCITTTKVHSRSASTVSVLAGYYDRWVEISVHNERARDALLKQMESLGFRHTKEDDYSDYYTDGQITLEVSNSEYYQLLTLDSLGNKVPLFVTKSPTGEEEPVLDTKETAEEIMADYQQFMSDHGFQCEFDPNDQVYYFNNGEDSFKVMLVRAEIWDGNYEFRIRHNNHWPITEGPDGPRDGEEYYGPGKETIIIPTEEEEEQP